MKLNEIIEDILNDKNKFTKNKFTASGQGALHQLLMLNNMKI